MAKSLQDRLKQRRSSTFVGREEQLELFRRNLQRPTDSEDYYFLFSVYGQGGVGKTTLLKKYRALAKEADTLTAYVDEDNKSIPEVLARFAQQLKEQDAELSDFDKRYKTYLQEKKRLEADPEAPKGAWQLGGRLIARTSKTLTKELVPGAGLLLESVDADALGDQMGAWAAFVKKRLTNKDEVQLLLQPVEVLTPLFLKGLEKQAERQRICLCFDTYEETSPYIDAWLRHLLEGQYGAASENLLFVIAGRERLDPNHWADYGDFLADIPLEPFTEPEAESYLEKKGITGRPVVKSILGLSGRLPVLVATLAEAAKHASGTLTDPCATAVERFLKWIDEPVSRDLALHAALPRRLNQDVIQCLLPEETAAAPLFQWLSQQPFTQKHQSGHWGYHSVVRALMLRHQFQLSRDTWSGLHNRLADFYDKRAAALGITEREAQFSNTEWLEYALEAAYHRLCAAYQRALPGAVADFVTVFRLNDSDRAATWAEAVLQAGKLWQNTKVGALLVNGVQAWEQEDWDEALPIFVHLTADYELKEAGDAAWLYVVQGWLEAERKRFSQGIQAYQKAIKIKPDYAEAYNNLGIALDDLGEYAQAIQAYQKAIELQPDYATAYYNLGIALRTQGEYAQAVQAYQKAIELQPDYATAYNNLGITLDDQGEYAQAVQAYQIAIELQPDYSNAYNNLGSTYLAQGHLQQAQGTYEQAFQINENNEYLHMNYAHCLLAQKQQEQAMAHYRRSREGFGDKASFFKGMADDYTDFRLGQYGMEEKAYFAVIEELKNEIKYIE